MDAISLVGGIALGADTSGNFRLSPNGIAIRRDDRFYALDEGHLIDVTEVSFDSAFVRIPVPVGTLRHNKDVIITSDNPVSALFVLDVTEGSVTAIDVGSSERVEYLPSSSLLRKERFVVKVAGLDAKGKDILPLLLLGQGMGNSRNDFVTQLLLLRTLKHKGSELEDLLPLLLLRNGQVSSGSDLLTQLLVLRALSRDNGKDKDKDKEGSELEDILPFLLLANNPSQRQISRSGAEPNDPFPNLILSGGRG